MAPTSMLQGVKLDDCRKQLSRSSPVNPDFLKACSTELNAQGQGWLRVSQDSFLTSYHNKIRVNNLAELSDLKSESRTNKLWEKTMKVDECWDTSVSDDEDEEWSWVYFQGKCYKFNDVPKIIQNVKKESDHAVLYKAPKARELRKKDKRLVSLKSCRKQLSRSSPVDPDFLKACSTELNAQGQGWLRVSKDSFLTSYHNKIRVNNLAELSDLKSESRTNKLWEKAMKVDECWDTSVSDDEDEEWSWVYFQGKCYKFNDVPKIIQNVKKESDHAVLYKAPKARELRKKDKRLVSLKSCRKQLSRSIPVDPDFLKACSTELNAQGQGWLRVSQDSFLTSYHNKIQVNNLAELSDLKSESRTNKLWEKAMKVDECWDTSVSDDEDEEWSWVYFQGKCYKFNDVPKIIQNVKKESDHAVLYKAPRAQVA